MNRETIRDIPSKFDSLIIAPFIDRGIKSFKRELGEKGVSVIQIRNLSEVLKHPPFSQNNPSEKPVVICDVHGVVTHTWKCEPKDGFRSLLGLARLAAKSREIIFISSGIKLNEQGITWRTVKPVFGGRLAKWPFWTDQTASRLESFVHQANPKCDVKFVIGTKDKLLNNGQTAVGMAVKKLQKGAELAVIGSSFTDRKMIRELTKTVKDEGSLRRIHYFDTGHLVI